jgi:DNA-directed RNA polymerase subunit beta
VKAYEHIVKGENIPAAEVPESFKVLVKEMKSLCLDVELIGEAREENLEDFAAEEPESLAAALMMQSLDEDDEDDALDLIASGLGDLDFASHVGDFDSLESISADLVGGEDEGDEVQTLFDDDSGTATAGTDESDTDAATSEGSAGEAGPDREGEK